MTIACIHLSRILARLNLVFSPKVLNPPQKEKTMGKLHDRMREDLILKGYSPPTQNGYLRCARTFARHFMRSPEKMGEQEIREFLLHLVQDRKVSAATQDQYVNAIKFLYSLTLKRPETVKDISHPKRRKTLPVILSPEE